VAAVVSNGGTVSSDRQTLVNDLIVGLKGDGLWTSLDRLWLLAGENAISALTDLVANSLATAVSAPTFTVDQGYTGNGTTSYVDTNAVSGSLTNYVQNSASFGYWALTDSSKSASRFGWFDSAGGVKDGYLSLHNHDTSDNIVVAINSSTFDELRLTRAGNFLVGNRPDSTHQEAYVDGAFVNSAVSNSVSLSGLTETFFVCGRNDNGSLFAQSDEQVSIALIGGSFTSGEQFNLYSRLATYMASVLTGIRITDPDVGKWISEVYRQGGTVSGGRASQVQDLVTGLKSDGVWTKLDRLWLFAAENSGSALVDLVARALAVATGSPTFTTDRGYTGASAKFLTLDIVPFSWSGLYTLNDAHYSAWQVTSPGASQGLLMGTGGSGVQLYTPYVGDSNLYARINDSPDSGAQGTLSTPNGHFVANRTGASLSAAFQNGALFSTINASSGSLNNNIFTVLTDTTSQVAMASIGGGLTSTNIANFYSRLRTYMSAVGVP
jgi:hypothetical protein